MSRRRPQTLGPMGANTRLVPRGNRKRIAVSVSGDPRRVVLRASCPRSALFFSQRERS